MANKKVFLYVGNNNLGGMYPSFTDADITRFHADEFVLTVGGYSGYLSSMAELTVYMDQLVALAKRVIELTGKTIWFGFPRPTAPTKTITISEYSHYADQYLEIARILHERLDAVGSNYYYNYVQGFYMNDEHVRRRNFGTGTGTDDPNGVNVDVNNLLSHPQIFMYDKVSKGLITAAHGWKKLLWSPYMGRGGNYDTTMIDIAYIANTTDIFNTVLLQPGYYFHGDADIQKNLAVIRNSLNRQEVRRRTNSGNTDTRVVAKKSSTIIGCQMEIDELYFKPSAQRTGYQNRYAEYVTAYSGSKVTSSANHVFSFYCDKKNPYWSETQDKVNAFFDTL